MTRYLIPRLNGALLGLLFSAGVVAAELQVQVVDGTGQPLENAVLTLTGPLGAPAAPLRAEMDQKLKQFAPSVLVVRTGTAVTFPNSDNIRHHVYSFSPAKRFELRLYQGTPSEPVVFDNPGVVVLGCNIHDWMVGYIYVTEDPWFAVSDAQGQVQMQQLPAGRYTASLWHPQAADMLPQAAGELQVGEPATRQRLTLELPTTARTPPAAPAPSAFGEAFKKATRDAAQ
ncbi:methylamine utilization protein [Pseudomonas borbori]